MNFTLTNRKTALGRALLAGSCATGLIGAALAATPALAKDAAPQYSDKFRAAAGPLEGDLSKDQGKTLDAATIAGLKTRLDAVIAVATTPDDKYIAGNMSITLGGIAQDTGLQANGVRMELDSGKAPVAMQAKLHYFAGEFAYNAKDYAAATTELNAAMAAGFPGVEALTLLAETDFASKQAEVGLANLQKAIDSEKAAGKQVPESWYQRGAGVAFEARLLPQTAAFGSQIVAAYPTKVNWHDAINRLRAVAKFQQGEDLDLMRLMAATNSYTTADDYIYHIQDADPNRLPGEAQTALQAGIASGQLSKQTLSIQDDIAAIDKQVGADRKATYGKDAEAHAASTSAQTLVGIGNGYLSYGEGAKAADAFSSALAKGVPNPDLANTRLGIALVDAGDYAGAQAAFAKVSGPRVPIAQLWMVYARQKAAPAPAPASAPAHS